MRRTLLIAGVLAMLAAAPASAQQVSDETTRTVPAEVKDATWIRSEPEAKAKRVARLRTRTYHGSREVVVVLSRNGSWSQVRYAGIGHRVGWVMTKKLRRLKSVTTRLVIDRKRTTATLFKSGERVFSTRVGVGASGSPTPGGRFYVREMFWTPNPGGTYGPLAFGLSSFSRHRTSWAGGGQVGIHGTNQPGLIPGRISNGCVRVRNRAIRRLERLMPVGTSVEVL
jgi:hypothetical protein